MSNTRLFWGVVAFIGAFCPMIGFVVGCYRYRKNKENVLKEVNEDYKKAQEKGGFHLLFDKKQHRRVFAKTFGFPVNIGIFVGLAIMIFAFCMMK